MCINHDGKRVIVRGSFANGEWLYALLAWGMWVGLLIYAANQ